MTFKTVIAAAALVASTATFASADQLAKLAGVEPGVYSASVLHGIIEADQNQEVSLKNFLLGQTIANTAVSSKGQAGVDFDSLIAKAVEDEEFGRAVAIQSKANSGTVGSGSVDTADILALIAQAEQDDERGRAAALKSRLN